tara:strand:- start:106 stop:405 length:300 start_codon:yes stop_codon:yes gene_type:complete
METISYCRLHLAGFGANGLLLAALSATVARAAGAQLHLELTANTRDIHAKRNGTAERVTRVEFTGFGEGEQVLGATLVLAAKGEDGVVVGHRRRDGGQQ